MVWGWERDTGVPGLGSCSSALRTALLQSPGRHRPAPSQYSCYQASARRVPQVSQIRHTHQAQLNAG